MRDKTDLLGLKSNQLSQEEIEELGELGLNLCEKCGSVEISEELVWVDCEEFWDDGNVFNRAVAENKTGERLCKDGVSAVCNTCFEKEMIMEKLVIADKAMLDHFNEKGLAEFNKIGQNTSTFAFMIEQAVKDYEEEYKINVFSR